MLSYAPDGTLRWVYGDPVPNPENIGFLDLEVDPVRERVYLSGDAPYGAGGRVIGTRALRLDGRPAWTAVERLSPGTEPEWYSVLTVDPASGAVHVASAEGTFAERRIVTLAYDASSTFLWSERLAVDSQPYDIGVDSTTGRVYVVGQSGDDAIVTSYSATGEPVWSVPPAGPSDPEAGLAVAVDPTREPVYVGGYVLPQYIGLTAHTG